MKTAAGNHLGTGSPRRARAGAAFTMVEILIAIGIFSLVLAAIFSTWTSILRATRVGNEATAKVQRARIALRMLEDSLGSAQAFAQNQRYYAFMAENGDEGSLSFVARLAKSFPRGGKFGDLDVRRLTYSVESDPDGGRQLVLRQCPVLMEMDKDEKEHPLVIAKNVKGFGVEFWDQKKQDWLDEWTQTNSLPKVVRVTLKLEDKPHSLAPPEEITRIVGILATTVPPGYQVPPNTGAPGGQGPPGSQNPPGSLNPPGGGLNNGQKGVRLQ